MTWEKDTLVILLEKSLNLCLQAIELQTAAQIHYFLFIFLILPLI